MDHTTLFTLSIAAIATLGVIVRPWSIPEYIWAVLGAKRYLKAALVSAYQGICVIQATCVGRDGHPSRRAAMSPVHPLAITVGEPGIIAVAAHDRTVA